MAIDFAAMMKQAEKEMMQQTRKNLSVQVLDKTESKIKVHQLPNSSLSSFALKDIPKRAYYVPNFVDSEEAAYLVSFCASEGWIQLKNRKLKNFGGVPHLS